MPRTSRSPGSDSASRPRAAHDDGAVDQRGARGVALELGRVRQAEVLDQQLADRGGGEALVAVAHGCPCNSLCNWESTFRDPRLTAFAFDVTRGKLDPMTHSSVAGPVPPRRRPRRQPDPVRPVQHRLRHRVQPGHAHRGPRRPGRPVRAAGRAARRGRRRRGAQALPRLQPGPRVGARLEAVARDPRDRHPAGLRHRPPGRDPGREQDRARPDRGRRRRRLRHHLRRAGRDQREAPQEAAQGQRRQGHPRPAGRPRARSAPATSAWRSRRTASRAPACRWASTPR